jgi:hypothetical protein
VKFKQKVSMEGSFLKTSAKYRISRKRRSSLYPEGRVVLTIRPRARVVTPPQVSILR